MTDAVLALLRDNHLLLFFLVAAVGTLLGRLRVGGFSLGVAAVLFTGLAVGALDPALKLPEFVYAFGLVLFVYTVGLSAGPGLVAAMRRRGLRDNAFALGVVALGAAVATLAGRALGLSPALTVGVFAGGMTNTPALASALEFLKGHAPAAALERVAAEPVVAYSVAYPFGVVGALAGIYLFQKLWRVDYQKEARGLRNVMGVGENLVTRTVVVTREGSEPAQLTVDHLRREHGWRVLFTRLKRGDAIVLARGDEVFHNGDVVTMVGGEDDIRACARHLGSFADEQLELDRSVFDFRRMFVSNPKIAGLPVGELCLAERYGAVATRVRRGDQDLLADEATVLELGDRVRVVAPRERMPEVTALFGDSFKALSEIDVISFALGIGLGLLVGAIPIPLPTGTTFKLGFAGGPLLVGLALGLRDRTGPLVWNLPYNANLTLRQLGLVLFLAGVGLRSGYAFVSTLRGGGGLSLLLAGAGVTTTVTVATLWVGHRVLKIPMGVLTGMLAGIQTQPAVLAFANEQTRHDLPGVGYATVYPVTTIAKIVLAQVLLALLRP